MNCANPILAMLFSLFCSCCQGAHCATSFENYVALVLAAYYQVFLKACRKLDHMTHLGFHGARFRCFSRWVKTLFFLQKPLTKDTVQMALFWIYNASAKAKIALCTYLKSTLSENFVGWAKIWVLREYSIACGYRQSSQSRCWSKN